MDYLKLGVVGVVIIMGLTIWYNVTSTINGLKSIISTRDTTIVNLTGDLDKTNAKLIIEQANTKELKRGLDLTNSDLSKVDKELTQAKKDLETWRLKPLEIKYIESVKKIITNKSYDTDNCEEGKKLNLEISKLKYKEL